jgi:L-threonylcarbamoyladenylate synthase
VESTVVDARGAGPVVLRPGPVGALELGLSEMALTPAGGAAGSPGIRHRHYAPTCEVMIAEPGLGPSVALRLAAKERRVGLVAPSPAPGGVAGLARPADAAALAEVLYAALRAADGAGLEAVVVEAVAETGIGVAVMDRLRRAAAGAAPDARRSP